MTKRILITGLVAGTFDGLAAIIHLSILGKDPIRVFNFIASGVFGKAAYTDGLSMILAGIALHYIIATIWTFIYFMIYPKIKAPGSWVVSGLIYGVVVWAGMNLIVLPLSNIPPLPFTVTKAVIAALILMLCIGLPISFSASKYFSKKSF